MPEDLAAGSVEPVKPKSQSGLGARVLCLKWVSTTTLWNNKTDYSKMFCLNFKYPWP